MYVVFNEDKYSHYIAMRIDTLCDLMGLALYEGTSMGVETMSQLPDILAYFHLSCPAPILVSIYQTFTSFIGQCPA